MTALRKLPYIPLYVNDFSCDEKLRMCSPAAVGVYIFLLCFLHKSDTYGKLILRPKDRLPETDVLELQKQIESKTKSKIESTVIPFAKRLQRNMPFELHEIADGINELAEERVITIDGDELYQRRMIKDGEISEKRSINGALGGRPTKNKEQEKKQIESKSLSKRESELKANTENEYAYENNIESEEKEVQGERKRNQRFTPPTLEEVMQYCEERSNGIDAIRFFDFYEANGWVQGKQGKPLKDWKAAVRTWERNGIETTNSNGRPAAPAAPTGGFGEVRTDTPAKKTRHTSF